MAFSPDSSASYAAYLAAKSKLSDGDAAEFDAFLIKYFCQQADAATAVTIATAVSSAKASALRKAHTF